MVNSVLKETVLDINIKHYPILIHKLSFIFTQKVILSRWLISSKVLFDYSWLEQLWFLTLFYLDSPPLEPSNRLSLHILSYDLGSKSDGSSKRNGRGPIRRCLPTLRTFYLALVFPWSYLRSLLRPVNESITSIPFLSSTFSYKVPCICFRIFLIQRFLKGVPLSFFSSLFIKKGSKLPYFPLY